MRTLLRSAFDALPWLGVMNDLYDVWRQRSLSLYTQSSSFILPVL